MTGEGRRGIGKGEGRMKRFWAWLARKVAEAVMAEVVKKMGEGAGKQP